MIEKAVFITYGTTQAEDYSGSIGKIEPQTLLICLAAVHRIFVVEFVAGSQLKLSNFLTWKPKAHTQQRNKLETYPAQNNLQILRTSCKTANNTSEMTHHCLRFLLFNFFVIKAGVEVTPVSFPMILDYFFHSH